MEVSFEFFPPKTQEGMHNLLHTAKQLVAFSPNYYSVTYGAGGSTKTYTCQTIDTLRSHIFHQVVPHISCLGTTKATIHALLNRYQQQGINKLIALRGDLPSGEVSTTGDFKYAHELVSFIRAHFGDYFDIMVAVYPECHPQSSNTSADLQYFRQKVQSGANGAITQYFYDANAYYWLLENCRRMGVDIPIIPGIMPITQFKQLELFSLRCGAEIPRWMKKQLISYGDDIESIKKFGIDVVTKLCEQLMAMGTPGLHFYTLNKADAVVKILSNLNLNIIHHEPATI